MSFVRRRDNQRKLESQYGADGYSTINDVTAYPTYAQVTTPDKGIQLDPINQRPAVTEAINTGRIAALVRQPIYD